VAFLGIQGDALTISFGGLYGNIDRVKTDYDARISDLAKKMHREAEVRASAEAAALKAQQEERLDELVEKARLDQVFITVGQIFREGILVQNIQGYDQDRKSLSSGSPAFIMGIDRLGLAPGQHLLLPYPIYLCGTYTYTSRNGSEMEVPRYTTSKEDVIPLIKEHYNLQ